MARIRREISRENLSAIFGEDVYTLASFAKKINVSLDTARKMYRAGLIPAFKMGANLYTTDSLVAFGCKEAARQYVDAIHKTRQKLVIEKAKTEEIQRQSYNYTKKIRAMRKLISEKERMEKRLLKRIEEQKKRLSNLEQEKKSIEKRLIW